MPGLYIHIPFCVRKCSYCAFYSVVSTDRQKQLRFFQCLENEIKNLPADFLPDTVFVGGGTPTAPDFQILENFFSILREFSPAEFSVEVNPGTADLKKLHLLRNSGVNRLSLGVQSFQPEMLETLGRIHSAKEAETAFGLARGAGFENISLDLIFGVPGQTMAMLESDLDRALALGPEHIAIYNLMDEEGTPLTERNLPRLDEELERDMYDRIRERLRAAGFIHYEISNFAKPGYECRHNLLYWSGGEYIGCGPAAHSHWMGARWANVSDLDSYCWAGEGIDAWWNATSGRVQNPLGDRVPPSDRKDAWPPREFEERLDPAAKARETLVMGLRRLDGAEVPPELAEELEPVIRRLQQDGLLQVSGRRIRLTEEALFVSDAVFMELV